MFALLIRDGTMDSAIDGTVNGILDKTRRSITGTAATLSGKRTMDGAVKGIMDSSMDDTMEHATAGT